MKEQETHNAIAKYMEENPGLFYNAPENRYNENVEVIATTIPFVSVPPVRGKPASRRHYTAHGENQRIMNLMRETALRQIHPELNFRSKSKSRSKSKTRRSKRY